MVVFMGVVTVVGGIALWRLVYLVEWRRGEPGRHAAREAEEPSRDDPDAITAILPAYRYDVADPRELGITPLYPRRPRVPSYMDAALTPKDGRDRLEKAVRRWTELNGQ